MRPVPIAAVLLGITLVASPATADPPPPARIVLSDVSHGLENQMLVITGLVRNLTPDPVARLVIDVNGYGPRGELLTSGTDGIPWEMPAATTERFTIALPLGRQLVREYVVQVSAQRSPGMLSSVRRGVDVGIYRDHLRSLVRVSAQIEHGILVARADAAGLPVSQVTIQATVWMLDPLAAHSKIFPFVLDISPDRFSTVFLPTPHAILLTLRVLDIRLKASWSD